MGKFKIKKFKSRLNFSCNNKDCELYWSEQEWTTKEGTIIFLYCPSRMDRTLYIRVLTYFQCCADCGQPARVSLSEMHKCFNVQNWAEDMIELFGAVKHHKEFVKMKKIFERKYDEITDKIEVMRQNFKHDKSEKKY